MFWSLLTGHCPQNSFHIELTWLIFWIVLHWIISDWLYFPMVCQMYPLYNACQLSCLLLFYYFCNNDGNLPSCFVYLTLLKCRDLSWNSVWKTFKFNSSLNVHNKSAAFKDSFGEKRLLLMKRIHIYHLLQNSGTHRTWSKKTGQNTPALCSIIKMLGVQKTQKDATLKKDIRSQRGGKKVNCSDKGGEM